MPIPLGTHLENGAIVPDEVELRTEPVTELLTNRTSLNMDRRVPLGIGTDSQGRAWDIMAAVYKDDPNSPAAAIIVRGEKDNYGVIVDGKKDEVISLDPFGNQQTYIDLGDGLAFQTSYEADRSHRLTLLLDPNSLPNRLYERVAVFPASE